MPIPRVQRMVMFKHGVAYVERGGPASGDFELSFKKDEMNDVLKSLNVWVARGEATVGALGFDKPEDPLEALAERSLDLPLGSTMYSLLGAFRGRAVAIESGGTRYEGEIVGLDRSSAGENGDRTRVSLRAADGSIVLVDLDSAQSIELQGDAAQADLDFVLDRTRAAAAGRARFVRVGLTGHAEDLRISYVIPAPAWRVSYRLARDGDTGAATLHAWGIVHNPADEDLDDLELTLTTGQPVSFVIDLYTPKNVRRVVVEESSRVAAAPTSFERAPMPPPAAAPMAAPSPMMAPSPMSAGGAAPSPFGPPSPPPPPSPSRPIEPPAAYADRGELFEYRVGPRVSLRRGGSAMVPLLSARLEARRERIWRAGAAPSPDLVLTFGNGSGAVLEEGPVVLYDENVYAGEAMVPYSARGAEVKLAFAKDLGVRCKRTAETRRVVNGVRIGPDALFEEHRREEHHTIQVENDHPEEAVVIVELPKVAGHSFDPGFAQPFEETASFHRFRVTAPPHARAVATVVERWHDSTRIEYAQVTTENLDRWMNERFLDPAWFRAFADIRTEWYAAQEAQGRAKVARKELEDAYAKQAKLAEQLEVLKEGGPEGQLRLRYVQELATEQDRVNACEAEAKRREAESRAASERGRAKLGALVGVRR